MMKYKQANIILLISFLLLGFSPQLYRESFNVMATFAHITIFSNKSSSQKIFKQVLRKMQLIEDLMSDYKKDSDIAKINKNSGKLIPISPQTLYVIKEAIEISKQTEGAFDITIRPLMELWGFKERILNKIPSDSEIKEVFGKIGWQKIKIVNNNSLKLDKGMEIDLGGIAKGYAVDQAIEVLKENGVKNAIVEIGGDLYCLGNGPQDKGWIIGIQHPKDFRKILGKLRIKNRAVATSGNYENFRIINGKKYSHIIDPRTGFPVENGLLSVTVIAPNCLQADAWATALFVLGEEEGMKKVEQNPDIEAIFVKETKGKKLQIKA